MRLFRPLRDPNMAILWTGASIGAVGLQIYDASIAWIAVEALGNHASWVVMVTAFISLLFALFGGLLVDRFDDFQALSWIDAARGLLVLVPVVWLLFSPDALWLFVPTVLLSALLRALPLPLLYGALPRLSREIALLNAMNALIDGAQRLSRILGPLVIAALQNVLQQIAILGMAALCFFISSVSAWMVKRRMPADAVAKPAPEVDAAVAAAKARPLAEVAEAFRAARARPPVWYALMTNIVGNGAWQVGYILGVALMIQSESLGDLGGYAAVMTAYGCGNIASSLIFGNIEFHRPPWWTRAGHTVAGIGYVAMACAPDINWLMAAAALTASGAPMADLSFLTQIQTEENRRMVARFYRLRLVGAWIGALAATSVSSLLYELLGIRVVIAICGLSLIVAGIYGFHWQQKRSSSLS